jgi:hypothetical protein
MDNRVRSDNVLAQPPQKSQRFDSGRDDPAATGAQQRPATASEADIARAQRRLAQDSGSADAPVIDSLAQARARVEAIKSEIQDDPRGAIHAHRGADDDTTKPAMARPPA